MRIPKNTAKPEGIILLETHFFFDIKPYVIEFKF